jgi:ATP-binding cassette subfamily B protein/subfamily B ATP-binding cassette protein MsbA
MNAWWQDSLRYPARHRGPLAWIVVLSLLSIGFNLLLPWPVKLIVDGVLAGKPLFENSLLSGFLEGEDASRQLLWLALASAGLFVLLRATEMARASLAARIGRRMQYELGGTLFLALQRLSPRFHARSQTGDLVRRVVTDSKCVDEFFVGICIPAFTSALMLVAMFAILVNMSPEIALLAALMALPVALLVHRLIPVITEQSLVQQNIEGQVMSFAETNLSAQPIVHAFDRAATEGRRFRTLTGRSVDALARATASEQLFGILAGGTIALGTALVLGVGAFQVLDGKLELGSLLVILAYLALLYAPVETLARLSAAYAHSAAKGRRAFAILSERDVVEDPPRGVAATPERAKGAIHFENVSFGYGERGATLRNIDMAIEPGQTIAIVGPTGAGKSTLIALALRLFDPDEGRITLDGIDLRQWGLDSLRRQFGLVLQDPFLLPLSAAENIAFGSASADAAKVSAAAEAAGADTFIRKLPEGYAGRLGERGAALSGGERQRIAIARALYRDAPVLVLDEPTAALDVETERHLLATIHPRERVRTTIIIAHRLSTIRAADVIFVLDKGRIVESGAHLDLLAQRDLYFRLHQQSLSSAEP